MSPRPLRKTPEPDQQLAPQVEPINVGAPPPSKPAPVAPPGNSQTVGRPRSGSEDQPRYRQMVRTEARLRPDQVADLAALRRRVAAAREVKEERITDNTLVRIAVDLLLAHSDQLAGDTEDQLRASVVPEDSQSS